MKRPVVVTLRPVTREDAAHLYQWRIDPTTIAMSDGPPPADFAAHVVWLTKHLDAPAFYIAEDGTGEPVGTIRVDGDEVSLTVAPGRRNCGYAQAMIAAVCQQHRSLVARIKPDNVTSMRAFGRSGFVPMPPRDDAHLWFYYPTK